MNHPALALWAKSGEPPHSLLGHLLDTAAVAISLLEREPARTRRLLASDWDVPEDEAVRLTAWLAGLHDLGKAVPLFQRCWPPGAVAVEAAGFRWDEEWLAEPTRWIAHGVFTEVLLHTLLPRRGFSRRVARRLGQALGAHHGFPASPIEVDRARGLLDIEADEWEGTRWDDARLWLMDQVQAALSASVPAIPQLGAPGALRIMALASFADWIASDASLFPYDRDPTVPSYFQEARELAERALDRIGWRPKRPFPAKSFTDLFPFSPNPLQRTLPTLLADVAEPVLVLIEAPMGIGKTEAALYAYHRLRQVLDHRGLYVALPTQATANALFQRIVDFLRRAGEPQLDVQLQHGTATLHPLYAELLEAVRPTEVYDQETPGQALENAREGAVAASAWFSARKRAMLAEHGIGTLDQALLGVLRVKHHFIRLFGLMNRVVVLDEVHAYDVYTSGLIESLLRWLRALGSSVILMTATLPPSRRRRLLTAWTNTTLPGPERPYPRVTAVYADGRVEALALPAEEPRTLELRIVPVEVDIIAHHLRAALPGAIGAIVNSVDRAQQLYQALGDGSP